MKIIDVPSMPKFKFRFYLSLLGFAFLLLGWLRFHGEPKGDRFVTIIVSVMLSLFITTGTDLIPEIARRFGDRLERGKFRQFFGDTAFTRNVRLVFAHRRLKLEVAESNPWVTHHTVPSDKRPEGVQAWLAFQDVHTATYLANKIFDMTGKKAMLIHDKDIDTDDFDFCAISIGLGFNGFTHRLASLCEHRLFEIGFGKSQRSNTLETDLFKINGKEPRLPKGKDYSIVARTVLRPVSGSSNRICFVCAGRTASGTVAAGLFLAENWKKLMELYTKENRDINMDSLVVVISHTEAPDGTQDYDSSGVIVPELIKWHKVSGLE